MVGSPHIGFGHCFYGCTVPNSIEFEFPSWMDGGEGIRLGEVGAAEFSVADQLGHDDVTDISWP
jgi:hypothetical protein